MAVNEWHARVKNARPEPTLAEIIASIMTEQVTRSLPPQWQGAYDEVRARRWIADRDREGPTLLVADRQTGEPVGLVILHEIESDDRDGVDVRLGYMLAESAWGKGLATELIAGLVDWCRSDGGFRSLAGGVAIDNPASMRVLEKNGFRPVDELESSPDGEVIYELILNE